MDSTSLVVSALFAGAAVSTKDTTSQAIKEAYNGLHSLLLRKFADKPKVRAALIDYEEDPDTYDKPLKKVLSNERIEQDHEILAAATRLMTLVESQQKGQDKHYMQNTGKVEGQIIGENNQITQHFRNIYLSS